MHPKKSKEFYSTTAEQLNVSEDLVKDVVEMYWSQVRKALTDMKHININVQGFGSFKPKPRKLQEAYEKYERIFNINDGSSFRKMAIKKEIELRITNIKNLLAMTEESEIKRSLIKIKRDEYISKNLEK